MKEEEKWILKCPECGAENNWHFVMYYGDECFNCDFDIREHIKKDTGKSMMQKNKKERSTKNE